MDKKRNAWVDDIEPERYYEWILWKLKQEKDMEQDDPTDDVSDSALKWANASKNQEKTITREEILKKEISSLQECLNNAYKRIVELNDELQNLKDKNSELRALSVEELQKKLVVEKENLEKLIFSHAATPIENPMRIKVARRFVARIKTEINNKALKA